MLWQDFTEICILRAVQMWSPDAVIVSSAITLHLRSCRILNAILSLAVSCLSTSHITVLLEIVMFRIFLLICYWSYLKARNTLLLDQVGKLELNNNYANLNLFFMAFRSPAEVHLKPVSFDEVAWCSKGEQRRCIDVIEMQRVSFSCWVPIDKELGYKVNFYDLQDITIPFWEVYQFTR